MRLNRNRQLPLSQRSKSDPVARKYQVISDLLDEHGEICELAANDLYAGKNPSIGRTGMTGEQAVRAAVLYRLLGVPYEDFRFLVTESPTFRNFCRLPMDTKIGVSTLAENIKSISPKTWESIHEILVLAAKKNSFQTRRQGYSNRQYLRRNQHSPSHRFHSFARLRPRCHPTFEKSKDRILRGRYPACHPRSQSRRPPFDLQNRLCEKH